MTRKLAALQVARDKAEANRAAAWVTLMAGPTLATSYADLVNAYAVACGYADDADEAVCRYLGIPTQKALDMEAAALAEYQATHAAAIPSGTDQATVDAFTR